MRRAAAPPRPHAPRLWRDLLALAGGQLASKSLGFLAFAFLARALTPGAYGAVEYAAGIAFLGAMFVDAGSSPVGVRRIARDPAARGQVAAEVLGARLLLALLLAALLVAASPALAPDTLTAQLIALFAVGLLAVPWTPMWLFQAVDRVAWTAGLQALRNAVFLAVVVLSASRGGGALWVGAAEIVALTVAGAAALTLQARHVAPVRLSFDGAALRRLLAESLPLGIAELIVVVTAFAPLLLAVNLHGAEAAATFAGAHRLYFALLTFSWIYHFNFFPVVARAGARGEGLRGDVESSFRLVAWTGALAAAVLTLVGRPLLAVVFGPPFADAAGAFALFAWALPVKAIADHAAWALVAIGAERAVVACRLAALAALLAAGIPLVRAAGPIGGAVALLGASLLLWGALHVVARRRLGWMPWAPALAAATVGLLAVVAARALRLGATAGVLVTLLAFAVAALPLARRFAVDYRHLADAKAQR
ncbi:MAG: lipopolysaccharide biosynthesis protein [Thermoanaerobaculia bacterium]|nr:lipopolysaccharide biosynthesis protein [Thermoanaerobaculia bacterium]